VVRTVNRSPRLVDLIGLSLAWQSTDLMITSNFDNFSSRIVWITNSVSIVYKQPSYVNHTQICSWNQQIQRVEGKHSCSCKQRKALMGFKLTTVLTTNHTAYPQRRADPGILS